MARHLGSLCFVYLSRPDSLLASPFGRERERVPSPKPDPAHISAYEWRCAGSSARASPTRATHHASRLHSAAGYTSTTQKTLVLGAKSVLCFYTKSRSINIPLLRVLANPTRILPNTHSTCSNREAAGSVRDRTSGATAGGGSSDIVVGALRCAERRELSYGKGHAHPLYIITEKCTKNHE